jgi:hypothetical protein
MITRISLDLISYQNNGRGPTMIADNISDIQASA